MVNPRPAFQPVPRPEAVSYDAVLLVSFGGPEGPDDVMPFLRRVTAGRGVPEERLVEVAGHYQRFGGVSPINGHTRALKAALEALLGEAGPHLPVYWGNRNWHPLLVDTVATMAGDGIRRAVAFVTSAYSSYSSCRQYLEDIARARQEVGPAAPVIDKIRPFYNHPGFIGPFVRAAAAAVGELPPDRRDLAELVFTAHSIPLAMAQTSDYERQLRQVSELVASGLAGAGPVRRWQLAFQSRSGPPSVPWLEPDVSEVLAELSAAGAAAAVLVPIGFVADHMEVIFDLDVEAAETAQRLGLPMTRAATPGRDPEFVAMVRELILERLDAAAPARAVGSDGPRFDTCGAACCPAPTRSVRPQATGA